MLLVLWALTLITGFGLVYWGEGSELHMSGGVMTLGSCLYFSGTSFFTLGLGDIAPLNPLARTLVVLEAGMGFGLLAMVISYLPSINQAFAKRELHVALLDARAGSPPTAYEILRRNSEGPSLGPLTQFLHQWEHWSAELLESHLSFPMLVYFRSQHDNQSWLAALTSILDASAFLIASLEGECARQAKLTFALARHTLVDVALVLNVSPFEAAADRLPDNEFHILRSRLEQAGLHPGTEPGRERELYKLRGMYEPYVHAFSDRLLMPLPPWMLSEPGRDNWQLSAGGQGAAEKHF